MCKRKFDIFLRWILGLAFSGLLAGCMATDAPVASASESRVGADDNPTINLAVTCTRHGRCRHTPLAPGQSVRADGLISNEPVGIDFANSMVISLRPETGVLRLFRPGWGRTPSQALIDSAYPQGAEGAGYAVMECGAARNRALRNCRFTEIEPANRGFEAAFRRLVREYRLAEGSPPPEQIRTVLLFLQLWDRRGPAPCNPTFCHIEYHTPPPPPPPPQQPRH